MSVFKCKICGGDFKVIRESNIAICEHCGIEIPLDNGKHETIYRIVDEAKLKELENRQQIE